MLYERYQNRFKLCALCQNRIISGHVVCQEHLPEMEQYHNELWFQELCRMQERQYQIDTEEYRFVNGLNYVPTLQKYHRTRGKQLTYPQRKDILTLYSKGVGARRIAKQLNISINTVNQFLKRNKKRGTFVK